MKTMLKHYSFRMGLRKGGGEKSPIIFLVECNLFESKFPRVTTGHETL